MTGQGRWLRRLVMLTCVPLFAMTTGCMSYLNPVAPIPEEKKLCCAEVPKGCRNHVYVFFVHGMDPLDCANLRGLRDYVQSLGFIKTYYGQMYHTMYFANEIRRIHLEDPDARFVLTGFSFGANMVRDICHSVAVDDIHIDLLVYLGGNTLHNVPEDRPDNVGQIVNILATGAIWNGDTLDGAINVNYADVYHFGSPTHPETLMLLTEELAKVAVRVPLVVKEPPPFEDEELTPRPVKIQAAKPLDQWDFLKVRDYDTPNAKLTPPWQNAVSLGQ